MMPRRGFLGILGGGAMFGKQIAEEVISEVSSIDLGTSAIEQTDYGWDGPSVSGPAMDDMQSSPYDFLKGGYKTFRELSEELHRKRSTLNSHKMPYWIKNKRSWSAAMKHTQWRLEREHYDKLSRRLHDTEYDSYDVPIIERIQKLRDIAKAIGADTIIEEVLND